MNISTIMNIIQKNKGDNMSAKPNQHIKQDVANKEKNQPLAEAVSAIVKTSEVVQDTNIEPINENHTTNTQQHHAEDKVDMNSDSNDNNLKEPKTPKTMVNVNDQADLSIENTIHHLESVIANYKILNQKIHANKNKIAELQKTTIKIRENKQKIEHKVQKNENDKNDAENIPNEEKSITDSNIVKQITDNKYFIKNKTCNNIKKNVEKIQNNIASDTKKSASYIEPLYLSCKLLKTHISYTQSLENTVAAFDIQRELELQQDDANELIKMLVDHFEAIKHYQPLADDKVDNEQQKETNPNIEKKTETKQSNDTANNIEKDDATTDSKQMTDESPASDSSAQKNT